jgi:hypothetical protein
LKDFHQSVLGQHEEVRDEFCHYMLRHKHDVGEQVVPSAYENLDEYQIDKHMRIQESKSFHLLEDIRLYHELEGQQGD